MNVAKDPNDESSRLGELQSYQLLDTAPEESLDELTVLAARFCETPVALVSLVDEARQWIKSKVGLSMVETTREISFCSHAIQQRELFVVPDATKDERFIDNPLVTGEPGVRFYAGIPLVSPSGHAIGTLCVIDHVPRQLTAEQEESLTMLGRQVMAQIELRRQATELARSERFLRTVIDSEPECVKVIGTDGLLKMMNPAGLALIEADSAEQVLGTDVSPLVEEEYRQAFVELGDRVFAGGSGTMEFRLTGLKGSERWLETHASPLRDESGRVTGLLAITRDLSQTRRVEHLLKKREHELSLALDSARMGTFDLAFSGSQITGNEWFERLWGFESEEFDGTYDSVRRRIHPGDRARFEEALDDCFATLDPFVSEFRVVWRDGSVHWVSLHGELSFDGESTPSRMRGVVMDCTERRLAEESLRHHEAILKETGEIANVGGWEFDPVSGEGSWTDEVARIHDLDPGTPPNVEFGLSFYEAGSRKELEKALELAISDGVPYDLELEFRSAKGVRKWVRTIGRPLVENGRTVRVRGAFQDITERKRLEDDLRQSQKLEAIGQLAGGIAHDFNNILTVIQGYGSILMMEGEPRGENSEAAQQIVQASERAATLTRQLLAFGRRQVMQPELLDLNRSVRDLSKMLGRIVGEDVRLVLDLHDGPLCTLADGGMLDQLLMNLVVNARDAMPDGGGLLIETGLRVLERDELAEMPGTERGSYVSLRVSDTGVGMSEAVASRIFEPFYTTKEQGKGTGLGLATVFGIIKQHRGWLGVESEPGKGSRFCVLLRESSERLAGAGGAVGDGGGEIASGTGTVLLVEDETPVRILARSVLERGGYEVLEAPHGVAALAIWEKERERIDLLLTDIVMPEGLSGLELASRMRMEYPGLPVVFTSGYSADIAGRELELEEGQNFVQKPASPARLLKVVRDGLTR